MTKQQLLTQNLHWQGQKLTQKTHIRLVFQRLVADLDFRPMVFLTGMRRVGKSTLIKQLIQNLIENKSIIPEQILFWEWNSQSKEQELEDILAFYIDEIADLKQVTYIFFDEIQFIQNYENVLKLYYDRYENLRFVCTGSLSFGYKKKMNESLAGRFIEYKLYPLSFEEYLIFSDKKEGYGKFLEAKKTENLNLKQGLAKETNPDFREFLAKGRFFDTIFYTENYQTKNYLDSIISQSLNQDSIDYFGISKPREINLLYQYFVQNNGGEISLDKISNSLELSWQTTNNYLDILELLGLIYPVLNTDNPLKQNLARKKIYTNSAFSLASSEVLLDSNLGLAVESYILERFLEQKKSIFYFRERDSEVDFINYQAKQAFEVKFKSQIKTNDYQNLLKISQKLKLQPVLVTLFHSFLDGSDIECIPSCLI